MQYSQAQYEEAVRCLKEAAEEARRLAALEKAAREEELAKLRKNPVRRHRSKKVTYEFRIACYARRTTRNSSQSLPEIMEDERWHRTKLAQEYKGEL